MTRRQKIWAAIVVVLIIAAGIVWETVPYVRYKLIPATGGTAAPASLTMSYKASPQRQYGYIALPYRPDEQRPSILTLSLGQYSLEVS